MPGDFAESVSTLRHDVRSARRELRAVRTEIEQARQRAEERASAYVREIGHRAGLAAFSGARLLADALTLEGAPSERLRAVRRVVGEPVTRDFNAAMGVTCCATEAADVRDLWNQLLAAEVAAGDLLGGPTTVLEITDAVVSLPEPRALRISVGGADAAMRAGTVAVPRFTYAMLPRKLNNFGHWLLDCLPHIAALRLAAPDATLLLPPPRKPFHETTLGWMGLDATGWQPWNGAAVRCDRLFVFENDGRAGGGRPLSSLLELRRWLRRDAPSTPGWRRIYVSRRDARKKRRWISNESAVADVFRRRGFEILDMAACPLDQQARLFQEARVVAGPSGAGLSDTIFSPPGTDVIVLTSDSLIRWYADQRGAKSLWARGNRAGAGRLGALGDSPRFYAHIVAAFGQTCHSFVGADQMPLDPLGAFIDDVLRRVETA